jgi:hypothetical protein
MSEAVEWYQRGVDITTFSGSAVHELVAGSNVSARMTCP